MKDVDRRRHPTPIHSHGLCGRPENVPGMKEFPPYQVAAGRVRSLALFDDQGYPFSAMKLGPGGGSRVQEMSRTVALVIK